ncbi:hypothetical protein [Streptomyces sp. JHA26]|uniref:hypothetical protein n=1 Tax=Streptomyces sp. JHA26 TaxID=1917143 RepID=UPI0015C56379|nr:hypothetical protein [Streptomyces sp. JHA26]
MALVAVPNEVRTPSVPSTPVSRSTPFLAGVQQPWQWKSPGRADWAERLQSRHDPRPARFTSAPKSSSSARR